MNIEDIKTQQLFDLTEVIFIVIKNDLNLAIINKKGLEILEYTEDEIIGNKWFDNFLPNRSIKEVKTYFTNVFKGNIKLSEYYEYPLLTKAGEEKAIAWYNSHIRSKDDEIIGILSTGIDITKQKKSEEMLKSSEALYKTLFESTGTGAILIEENGTISLCNTKFEEITGYSKEEVEGKRNWMELFPKSELERLIEFSRKTREEHSLLPVEIEIKLVNKQSELRDVIIVLNIIKESNQTIIIFFDITERKQVELQVQKEKYKAKSYLDVAAVMLVAFDVNGNITLINRKGCETLGYKESEILEQNWVDNFIPLDWRDNVKQVFSKLIYDDIEPFRYYENPVLTKDGSEQLIAWYNSVIKDEEQNVIGILSSGEDITEKRKAQEDLAFLYHLEQIFSRISADFISMSINDIDQGINNSLEQIANFTGAYRSSIIHFSEDFETLNCTHDWISESMVSKIQPLLNISSDTFMFFIDLLKNKENIVVQSIDTLPVDAVKEREWMKTNEIQTMILVPMLYEDTMSGTIAIFRETDHAQARLERLFPLLQFSVDMFVSALKRKEAEEVLEESEERYSTLLHEMLSGFSYRKVIFDDEGKPIDFVFLEVNDNYEKLTGMKRENIIGKRFTEIYPKIQFDQDFNWCEEYVEVAITGKPKRFVKYHTDLNSWFDISVFSIEKGFFATTFENITDRILAEKKIKESEEKYRSLVETMNEGLSVIDEKQVNTYVNKKLCEILGYTEYELLGEPMAEFLTEESQEIFANQMKERRKGKYEPYEMTWKRKDGTIAHTLLAPKILFNEKGDYIGSFAVITDISKRKKAEEALRKHKDHLEELVKERTAELGHSNQELEAFTYTVSHDLRAPLRAMQGFSQALLEDYESVLDDDGKEFASRIINAANTMNELITDLLNYSRIGRKKIDLIPILLSKLIEDVLKQHENEIKKSKTKITLEKIDCNILGQHSLVSQIIENLVSNALKFRKPEIDLTIKIWTEDYGDKIRFYIKDNGIGIDEEYFTKIFQVFERLHSTEKYPGTGIGLATVKKTAELLGGKVGVISTLGEGSIFWADFLKAKEKVQ